MKTNRTISDSVQHQRNLRVPVRDEPLHAVQIPLAGLLVLPRAEADALKVGTEERLNYVLQI